MCTLRRALLEDRQVKTLNGENGAIIRLYKSAIKHWQRKRLSSPSKEKPGHSLTGLHTAMNWLRASRILQSGVNHLKPGSYFFAR
jgi:hypothetical protein